MKVIVGERQTGKTARLIRMSAESGYYIVARSRRHASAIFTTAEETGLAIPFPITFDELVRGECHGRGIEGLLIDDADALVQRLARSILVSGVSLTQEYSSAGELKEVSDVCGGVPTRGGWKRGPTEFVSPAWHQDDGATDAFSQRGYYNR